MELPQQEKTKAIQNQQNEADRVEITFFTDPLCCWSWAFEPQWRRLQYAFRQRLQFRYVMTGLLPSWKDYSDPVYAVTRPMQMGPVWYEASEASGMPMKHSIWISDPPASSYPACIAVKSAQLQSQNAGIKYLRALREAVMLQGKNIAKQEVLLQVATALADEYPGLLNVDRFAADLTNDNGLEAFRKDWQEAQNTHITRTPTLLMRARGKQPIILTGFRPFSVLMEAFAQVAGNVDPATHTISPPDYTRFWGKLTERELQEINQPGK